MAPVDESPPPRPHRRRAVSAMGIGLVLVAGCAGQPLDQQLPVSAAGVVVGSPATTTPTVAPPPMVAPGARGGPDATVAPPPDTSASAPPEDVGAAPSTTNPGAPASTTTTSAQLAARLRELNAQDATLFTPDTTSLDADGLDLIEQVAAALKTYPGVRVEVAGHTDTNGTPESNQRISQQRAEAVRDRLVAYGVPAERLVAVGYGQTRPRATNDTVEGRAMNRRIEFTVLG